MTHMIEFGAYNEHEDFQCRGHPEPHIRSQNIVFRLNGYKWHIKITFSGGILRGKYTEAFLKFQKQYLNRRQQLQGLIKFIEFECLNLLENTVTEVEFMPVWGGEGYSGRDPKFLPLRSSISDLPAENGYKQFTGFHYHIVEDISRVLYPRLAKGLSVQTVLLSDIRTVAKVAPAITRVVICSDPEKGDFIFKSIDKRLYQPKDTEVLEREFENLQLFRHSSHIVHLVSAVTSTNPYHTGKSEDYYVLRGFLLEQHPRTLQEELETLAGSRWRQWPIQIAYGLQELHEEKLAHMDLKPSNIVINARNEAIVIDISGLATTYEWVADEMRHVPDPLSLSLEARQRNDIWAFGKLLSMMVRLESDQEKASLVQEVIDATTSVDPILRLELNIIIVKLEQILIEN